MDEKLFKKLRKKLVKKLLKNVAINVWKIVGKQVGKKVIEKVRKNVFWLVLEWVISSGTNVWGQIPLLRSIKRDMKKKILGQYSSG